MGYDQEKLEEGQRQESGILRKLLPLEVRGRAKQNIVIALLDPNDAFKVGAVDTVVVTPQIARFLRNRMIKQVDKLTEVLDFLDRENGLK